MCMSAFQCLAFLHRDNRYVDGVYYKVEPSFFLLVLEKHRILLIDCGVYPGNFASIRGNESSKYGVFHFGVIAS